jgi:beta-phosphoglucomutase-like phosphatase (HAD superfamily)
MTAMLVAEHPPATEKPPTRRPRAEPATRRPFELDTLASLWQRALDTDEQALSAAHDILPVAELARRRKDLAEERRNAAGALAQLARARLVPPPWLSPVAVTPKLLGLPDATEACLFDLDGVLTNSGVLHARAWGVVFNDLLQRIAEQGGWHFVPFDPDADYLAYIDGRPRLEGVHTFLASRGIRVPEGSPADPATSDTAYGLAGHKSEVLQRILRERGVAGLPGARRYLEASGHGGLKRAIVSASAHTDRMLELAGIATLVEERVDAETIRRERLRARPAPDVLLAACRRLEVDPSRSVTFTSTPAGVAAGHAAGLAVIGVGAEERAELLLGFGAERVAPSLASLLDRRLRSG